jgi:hypothetical protein
MNNMKNSKKNQQNDLLPRRKPRLGKFILAAVILHVVLAVFIIHFYKKKPEEERGIKVKPEKVISKPLAKEVLHAAPTGSSATFLTQSRPMAPSRTVAPEAGTANVSPAPMHARQPEPLPSPGIKSTERLKPSGEQIRASGDFNHQRRQALGAVLALPKAFSPAHMLAHQSEPLPSAIKKFTETLKSSGEQSRASGDYNQQRRQASGAVLALPKTSPDHLPTTPPAMKSKAAPLQKIIRKEGRTSQMHSEALPAASLDRAAQVTSKIASQQEYIAALSPLKPSPGDPKIGDLLDKLAKPKGLEDHLAELVTRLIQTNVEGSAEPYVRIRAKNLTYRDKGLESEGSKFLSGLVRAEIEKLDRVELLSPAEVSKIPDMELEGEIWDNLTTVSVHLRIKEHKTNRELDTAALEIGKQQLPEKMVLEPPQGESLDVIESVVELMKQLFPQRGDFQLGVWTDKGMDAVYVEGETLMVYILPETNAYLQVDYYQVDGKVVHLLPNVGESNFVKGGAPYIIGKSKSGKYKFVVGAPFGEELLVVVASQKPIKVMTPAMIEPAKPYIKRLAHSLREQKTKAEMTAAHYIILTKARAEGR